MADKNNQNQSHQNETTEDIDGLNVDVSKWKRVDPKYVCKHVGDHAFAAKKPRNRKLIFEAEKHGLPCQNHAENTCCMI